MGWTFKKTKIVCTLGPACESEEILTQMARAGMDVARLNFSHGSYEEHGERIRRVRRVSEVTGKLLGVMIDIQGPKLRIGTVPSGRIQLQKGQSLVLTTDPAGESDQKVFVPYPPLIRQVEPGMVIYLDDAKLELAVEEVKGSDLRCRVVVGGDLESHKGVSIPGVPIDLPAVTEKDRRDLRFAVANQVDLVAVSFVRRAEHLRQVRQLIQESGGRQALIAKIENDEGLANLDEIIEEADGLMVARGDLGVSLPPEEVPMIQKMIIQRCNRAGKPVITATQMLDSMKNSPRPTRAEVTDVANAILDGTDAVMLSGETAVGRFPVEAVSMMTKIALRTERNFPHAQFLHRQEPVRRYLVEEAISRATCQTAEELEARAIITSTQTGATARMVSRYRPRAPIIAATPDRTVARQLLICWGVMPVEVAPTEDIDAMLKVTVEAALKTGLVRPGEIGVITAGLRPGVPGSTNLMKVHVME